MLPLRERLHQPAPADRVSRAEVFAFSTMEPNAEVGAIHPMAMPVVLTTPDECDTWLTSPAAEALPMQRQLADGAPKIVARGSKQDPGSRSVL